MSSAAAASPLVVVVAGADGLEEGGDENVGFAASPMDAKISSCFGFGGCGLRIEVCRDDVAAAVPKEVILVAGIAGAGADTGAGATRVEGAGELSSSQSSQSTKY